MGSVKASAKGADKAREKRALSSAQDTTNTSSAGTEAAAEWVDTEKLLPWARNPRKNDENVARVAD